VRWSLRAAVVGDAGDAPGSVLESAPGFDPFEAERRRGMKSYRSLELKVGFTVLIAALIFIIGLMWFQGFKISRDYYELYAVFPQVGGVDPGDEVNVNGVERGSVKRVSLRENDVLLTMEIESGTQIPIDSKIRLQTVGIMGERVVTILLGRSKKMLEPGSIMQGEYDPGISEAFSLLGNLADELENLTGDMAEIARALNDQDRLRSTIVNLSQVAEQLNETLKKNLPELEEGVTSFRRAAVRLDTVLATNEGRIDTVLSSLADASRDLPQLVSRMDSLSSVLKDVAEGLRSDSTTVGALLSDRKLLDRLQRTIADLDELIMDIKANPGRYMKIELF